MNEIKAIITSRIANIIQLRLKLNQSDSDPSSNQNRYEDILEQKKIQKYRAIKENDNLFALNHCTLSDTRLANQLYYVTVDIMSEYDQEYAIYRNQFSDSIQQNIRKIYSDFFNTHGYKEKSLHVAKIFERGFTNLSPAILLGWLSEWSKKIYHQMLQKQVVRTFELKKKENKPFFYETKTTKLNNLSKKTQKLVQPQPDTPPFFVNSRPTALSYFLNELQLYYRFYDILDLDTNYTKAMKRRPNKQQLLKPHNLQKGAEVLIETTANKEISKIIDQYTKKYQEKYPRPKQSPKKQSSQSPPKRNPVILSPIKKIQRKKTQAEEEKLNKSKLLSPKISELEFLRPEEVEEKIKKLKLINSQTNKKNLEFPEITKFIKHTQKNFKFSKVTSASRQVLHFQKQKNKFSFSTMERRLIDSDFLLCEAVQERTQLLTTPHQIKKMAINKINKKAQKSRRAKGGDFDLYNDEKLKVGKTMDKSFPQRNRKALIIKNKIINDFE